MSKPSTLSQAANILTLLDEQKLDLEQVQAIRPYITALARSVKGGTLPDRGFFQTVMKGRVKLEELRYLVDFDQRVAWPFKDKDPLPEKEQIPSRVRGVWEFNPNDVTLLMNDGSSINTHEIARSLHHSRVFGDQLLDFYLDNQHLIPEAWKKTCVFFWGTVYYDGYVDSHDGRDLRNRYVRYLKWESGTSKFSSSDSLITGGNRLLPAVGKSS